MTTEKREKLTLRVTHEKKKMLELIQISNDFKSMDEMVNYLLDEFLKKYDDGQDTFAKYQIRK